MGVLDETSDSRYNQQSILHSSNMANILLGWFVVTLFVLDMIMPITGSWYGSCSGGRCHYYKKMAERERKKGNGKFEMEKCVFPFTAYPFTPRKHFGCTRLSNNDGSLADYHWCALTDSYDGSWRKCNLDDSACTIPFTAYGQTHYGCTRMKSDGGLYDYHWCAKSSTYTSGGEWAYCPKKLTLMKKKLQYNVC